MRGGGVRQVRLSRCLYLVYPFYPFILLRTLNVAMRLKRSLNKLYEAGCNLTRRMCIVIYCDKNKKVKVKVKTHYNYLIQYYPKVEIDFGSSGLLTGNEPINVELPSIADFLERSHEDWCKHLAQLRIKYPAIRSEIMSYCNDFIYNDFFSVTTALTSWWSWLEPSPSVSGVRGSQPEPG